MIPVGGADDARGVHGVAVRLLGHYHSVAHGQQQEEVHGVLGLQGGRQNLNY